MSSIRVDQNFTILPIQNTNNNATFADVIGNKTDAAASTADVVSVIGLLRYIVANLSTDAEVAALIGALDSATATGAVSDAKVLMSYIKQLVTETQVIDGNVDSILEDTGTTIPTLIGTPVADVSTDIATVDTVVDAIKAITDVLPDSGALTSIAQEATLGSPAGADLATDIASIKTDSGTTIPTLIGTPADTDVSTDIAAIKTVVDAILVLVTP